MLQRQCGQMKREREGQGEATHAYGTCPLSKALHHPRERERGERIKSALHLHRPTSLHGAG